MIKKLIILLFIITSISIVIQSCCEEKFKIIGNGVIEAYTEFPNPYNVIDTISGDFLISWQLELQMADLNKNFSLVQSCYATSCAEIYENEIVESSFLITCDRAFFYNNKEILAGTDLSSLDKLTVDFQKYWGIITIDFTDDFLSISNFDKEVHKFEVSVMTSDDMMFSNSLSIYIDI